MLITFTVPATDTGEVTVTRKDYQMQIDGNGKLVGAITSPIMRPISLPYPQRQNTFTQTVEFTGQRVQ